MSNNITIAILPENPNPSSQSEQLVIVENPSIKLADYSDKSFVIFGEATKTYITEIKQIGGKFNGRLKEKPGFPGGSAWIFPMKFKNQVIGFVNSVNTDKNRDKAPILSETGELELPTTSMRTVRISNYQWVKWKVFKPTINMTASIKAGGNESVGTVIDTEFHKDIIDTAYVSLGEGKKTKLVIINGKWQVWGYRVDHTVFFNNPVSKTDDGIDEFVNI